MSDRDISAEVEAAIEEVAHTELGCFGVERIEVVDAEDADGDPALLVQVHYSSPDADPDPKIASRLITKLNDRLYAMKETRFAYVAHKVPEPPRKVNDHG